MGKIVARVNREGIVRYTNNPATAQFAGMYIERNVSPQGKVAYYFLEKGTRKNTGWSLSQQEYNQAVKVGACIVVAQTKHAAEESASHAVTSEPKYYQKAHDYETGQTVGRSRTGGDYRSARTQSANPVRSKQAPQNSTTRTVMSQGSVDASQLPDNTAGFSMSYASNSEFFHDDSPAFNVDVLQDEKRPAKKQGFFSRIAGALRSFFMKPVVQPPTVKALPAAPEGATDGISTATSSMPVVGRHYRSQGAEVPMIPRGRN